jgi:hypothetical protein
MENIPVYGMRTYFKEVKLKEAADLCIIKVWYRNPLVLHLDLNEVNNAGLWRRYLKPPTPTPQFLNL